MTAAHSGASRWLCAPLRRRLRDYLSAPVRDALTRTGAQPPRYDINHLLHDSRSASLRTMPSGADTLLSAGCSGAWYFDWVLSRYGRVRRHIGIEYYVPKPLDLQADVEWIANTAADMSEICAASCDLVFSGQNLEHLWPEEVSGFLAEAARVTRPGGHLVIDSPNRALTGPLNWSHPEHTIELTVDEATELMTMAGFDITKVVGIWLCRDPRSGRLLPFDPNEPDAAWSVQERVLCARDNARDSFLWWVEGCRSVTPPDLPGIQSRMHQIFETAWPERTHRMQVGTGMPQSNDPDWVESPPGSPGAVLFGPYMPLKQGSYQAIFVVDVVSLPPGREIGKCEVVVGTSAARSVGSTVIPLTAVGAGPHSVIVEFTLDRLEFGVQFRCLSVGQAGFACKRAVDLRTLG